MKVFFFLSFCEILQLQNNNKNRKGKEIERWEVGHKIIHNHSHIIHHTSHITHHTSHTTDIQHTYGVKEKCKERSGLLL